MGWFGFLIKHVIRPYLPDKYPGKLVSGLHFVDGGNPVRYAKGVDRYIDAYGLAYSHNIGKLAMDILQASGGSVIERLEGIYDEIYVDEVQDLVGNDLDILESLLRSRIKTTLVGDVRQSIYSTSQSDQKNRAYRGLQKIIWFRNMEQLELCTIQERAETWRCNQFIIDFADSSLPPDLGFPATVSHQNEITGHDGVFAVHWKHLPNYLKTFAPTCYRAQINSKIIPESSATNFGQCKGTTVDRVLIYPTKQMIQFLQGHKPLDDRAASKFYVATTRAKHSVAIAINKDVEAGTLQIWRPH